MDEELLAKGRDFADWFMTAPTALSENNPFTASLQCKGIEVRPGEGYAKVSYETRAQHTNFLKLVHGGVVATALDETAGVAAMTLVGGNFRGTVNMSITYLSPARPGLLIGEAKVIGRTKSLIFVESSVMSEAGEVHARASMTVGYAQYKKADR